MDLDRQASRPECDEVDTPGIPEGEQFTSIRPHQPPPLGGHPAPTNTSGPWR
ncbi:hypothetical protein ACFVRD_35780 [Streptomyces sp. NPDC057908]|uniref:hypothetical protein n=1 Tax=Streptomyces sp. NPDC057908 TaxID=3346276 RepID=UPI0036EB5FDA